MIRCCLFGKGGGRGRGRGEGEEEGAEGEGKKKTTQDTRHDQTTFHPPFSSTQYPQIKHRLPSPPTHPSSPPTPLTPQPKQIAIATSCTTTIHPSHLCPSLPFPSRPLSIQSLATFQQFRTQSPNSKPHGSSDFNDRRDLKIGSSAKVCKIWGWGGGG